MDKPKYLYLTTTGHRSGKQHKIEIWYVEHGGCHYLISEKREGAHWVRNIRANAAITYRLGDIKLAGRASVPTDPDLIAAVKAKMDAKHGWSNGLVVQLCPAEVT